MKISCTQENLSQGLSIVAHIAGKNSNLPILSNILVKAEDKLLTLSATNLEIGITTQIRGKVEEDSTLTVDSKLFNDYISLLPKERIDLEIDGEELKIECEKQKTKIKTQPATEFPVIPLLDKNKAYTVSVKDFKDAISQVVFAVSNSEARPEISGVFMGFKDQDLILAATDSYRLAERKIKLAEKVEEAIDIIIPVKTLQEVSRVLGLFKENVEIEDVDVVEIYITDSQVMFSYNGVDLVSRLVEGKYPDYTQIIPGDFKTKVTVNISKLVKAVKSSSLFTKTGVFDIKLEFDSEKNNILITSSSAQTGENISDIEANVSGDKNSTVLNYRYLLDGLQNINSENVVIEMSDGNNPCLLKPENSTDYVYIIMPIRQ
jgi:DNA polymerase III subunit beta